MSHRRIFLLFLAFLAVLSGSTYFLLFRTGAATDFVKELIGKAIDKKLFALAQAELDLAAGKLTIRDFQLSDPKADSLAPALLSVHRVEVDLETNPLNEIGAVRRVALHQLQINLSVAENEAPDFSQIFAAVGVATLDGPQLELPIITITDSRLRLRIAPERPSIQFDQLKITLQPIDGEPDSVQIQGSMRSPMGHRVQITGGGNLQTKHFRTVLTVQDVPIKPEQATLFQEEARQFLDAAKVGGKVSRAQVWMEYQGQATEAAFRGGISVEFEDLQLTPPQFPYAIRQGKGKLFAESTDGGTLRFELRDQSIEGDLRASGVIERCLTADRSIDVHLRATGVLIGPRLLTAIDQGALIGLQQIQRALDPKDGRVDADIHISSKSPTAPLEALAKLEFTGVSARFLGFPIDGGRGVGFPHPIQGIRGEVTIQPDAVIIESLAGHDATGAEVSVKGQITGLKTPQPRVNLDILGHRIEFSKAIRQALASTLEAGPAIYDQFAPSGTTDVQLRLRDQGEGLRYALRLLPRSASASYAEFPLPVRNLTGSVDIDTTRVAIDLRGTHPSGDVKVHGRFLFDDAQKLTGLRSELWVKATDLSFDARLYTAAKHFHPGISEFWDSVSPRGTLDAEVALWREREASEFSYDAHLAVRDASIQANSLPMPVEKLHGDLFFHGKGPVCRCDISPVRAEIDNGPGHPPARVLVQGTLFELGGNLSADVTSIVQRLRLTDDLGDALQQAGIVSPQLWRGLKLDGFADVTAHHRRLAGQQDISGRYEIRLRDVSSAASVLPGKAQDLHGEIIIEGDQAHFTKFGGRIDESEIVLFDGSVRRQGDQTVVAFTATADSFPIDDRLANTMSGPVRRAFLNRKMRGKVGLDDLKVVFRFPDQGGTFSSEFRGTLTARDLFMDVGLPDGFSLKHLNGLITIASGSADANGGKMRGRLQKAQLELSNQKNQQTHQIHKIASQFEIDPSKLTLRDLSFQVAGGTVHGGSASDSRCLEYAFADRGRLYAYLNYQNLQLRQLLKNKALARSRVRGVCSGKVIIQKLEGGDFLDMLASGDLEVREGRLGTVPLFSAVYKHIREDKRPQFHKGRVEFSLEHQRIHFRKFNVESTLAKVEGQGSLGMDGYMDITLKVQDVFGSAANLLILPPLLSEVVSQIVQFKVFGYLRDPKIEYTNLFTPGSQRQALAPIPPVPVTSALRRSSQ